jgi:pimeloyl-ACP methyl ester carboxylesterase
VNDSFSRSRLSVESASDPAHADLDKLQPPGRSELFREARVFLEFPRLMFRLPELARQPRGHGQPVIILPGYGAGDGSTAILKSYLRWMGYQVRGWGLGRNTGNVAELLPRILKRLISLSRKTRQDVRLIGWSLGGYLAREVAREHPDLVRQIITLGTPVIGGPKYTVVARAYRRRGFDVDALAAEVESRKQTCLRTPVTAIYSRADGIVAWEACIDRAAANVEHIEVPTTHLGFGFSADVYKIIAQRLANNSRTDNPSMSQAGNGLRS